MAKLQAEIDAAGMGDPVKAERDKLRTEVERLRAALGLIAGMDNERGAAMVEVALTALGRDKSHD